MLFKRVLITGANGLLGQELVAQMSRFPDYDLLATARDPAPHFEQGAGGYVPLDITDHAAVRNLFQDFTPDTVINCAAMTQVDRCETDREACWRVNVDAVEHLARCCYQHGSRLVQVSTDFVFDGENGPYRETDRPHPISFYGKSKLASENAARGAGLDRWAVARTILVYGTGNRLSRSNIVLWVLDQLSRGKKIRVVTDQWRTPTYVVDLAAGIERIVRFNKSGIFHLSGREMFSIYEFAHRIARIFDLDASLIHPTDGTRFRQEAPRPPRTGFIILKAETELGYKPHSTDAALRHLGQRLGLPVTTP
ncbi:dTDP-4-dehydrorhamnose reductase [Rhodocaloribacter litoris]|nr:dTDP-4-dehydrorhamnose reductase [Rhodocaloribacter litoris]GIV60870.1 MAG: NAD(P)-dependent oxidoreductase [Rhodothermaceae bacterium]